MAAGPWDEKLAPARGAESDIHRAWACSISLAPIAVATTSVSSGPSVLSTVLALAFAVTQRFQTPGRAAWDFAESYGIQLPML